MISFQEDHRLGCLVPPGSYGCSLNLLTILGPLKRSVLLTLLGPTSFLGTPKLAEITKLILTTAGHPDLTGKMAEPSDLMGTTPVHSDLMGTRKAAEFLDSDPLRLWGPTQFLGTPKLAEITGLMLTTAGHPDLTGKMAEHSDLTGKAAESSNLTGKAAESSDLI